MLLCHVIARDHSTHLLDMQFEVQDKVHLRTISIDDDFLCNYVNRTLCAWPKLFT